MGARTSSGCPQGDSCVGSVVTLSMVIRLRKVTAMKQPSMNRAPCAKLTTPKVPKTRVSPNAINA